MKNILPSLIGDLSGGIVYNFKQIVYLYLLIELLEHFGWIGHFAPVVAHIILFLCWLPH